MANAIDRSLASMNRSLPDVVRLMLRLSVAVLLARPALSKFLTHENSVTFFSRIGIPFPKAMVVVAGIVELAAVVLLVFGVGEDLAALSIVPVMLVAIAYIGPDWKNLAVLGGALAIVVLSIEADSSVLPLDRYV